MHKNRLKILFLHGEPRPYVKRDIEILKSRYNVTLIDYRKREILKNVYNIIDKDLLFCWFGSLRLIPYILTAKLLGKKVIILTGGYDVANMPEYQYGNMFGIKKYFGRLIFMLANKILCLSKSNYNETIKNTCIPKEKAEIINFGFTDFSNKVKSIKHPTVITIGDIDPVSIKIKGLIQVARLTRLLPDIKFVFIGKIKDNKSLKLLKQISSKKTIFLGQLSEEEVQKLLLQSKIYTQLSLHESFGCAIAESMIAGCIPIVSKNDGIPEVAGNSGIYVNPENLKETAEVFQKVLDGKLKLKENPKKRILRLFPLSKRKNMLIKIVKETCLNLQPKNI